MKVGKSSGGLSVADGKGFQRSIDELPKSRWIRCLRALSFGCAAGVLVFAQPAIASQGALFGGPIGGTDIRQAYLPPPGSLVLFAGDVAGTAAGRYSNSGGHVENLQSNITGTSTLFAGGLYSYPFKVAGGTLASTVELPVYLGLCLGLAPKGQLYRSQCVSGQGDVYSDLLIWSRHLGLFGAQPPAHQIGPPLPYGLSVAAAYSMIFPTGEYRNDARLGLDIGNKSFIYIPSVALTYLTGPNIGLFGANGTEASIRLFYDISGENLDNSYRSGNVVAEDAALTERYGRFQVGVTASGGVQTSADKIRGPGVTAASAALEKNNYFGLFQLGPVVNLDLPKLGGAIKFKYVVSVWG